jgi:DNA topoisomerase VI subunit A
MSSLGNDIRSSIKSVGREWKQAKKASDRNDRVSRAHMSRMRSYRVHETTFRDAAMSVMLKAYNQASSNGKYYANARQVMYAARPMIIEIIGIEKWNDKTSQRYFHELLKDYIEDYDDSLRVVWDARGHLKEPHTQKKIGLGGAEVMQYREQRTNGKVAESDPIRYKLVSTVGPTHRYSAILFIEKEGFDIQLEDAGIAEKWDIAIMSSKGVPNAATCNVGAMAGVPVLALHDFDLAGFKIVRTLRRGTRLAHGIYENLIDIGFRLEDVADFEPEPVEYHQRNPKSYLRQCGATEEECHYLVTGRGVGQRVELNVLSTEQLITYLEKKFEEADIQKVVPDEEALRSAYTRAVYYREVIARAEEVIENSEEEAIPQNLQARIKDMLSEDPSQSWDNAIWNMASETDKMR